LPTGVTVVNLPGKDLEPQTSALGARLLSPAEFDAQLAARNQEAAAREPSL